MFITADLLIDIDEPSLLSLYNGLIPKTTTTPIVG